MAQTLEMHAITTSNLHLQIILFLYQYLQHELEEVTRKPLLDLEKEKQKAETKEPRIEQKIYLENHVSSYYILTLQIVM